MKVSHLMRPHCYHCIKSGCTQWSDGSPCRCATSLYISPPSFCWKQIRECWASVCVWLHLQEPLTSRWGLHVPASGHRESVHTAHLSATAPCSENIETYSALHMKCSSSVENGCGSKPTAFSAPSHFLLFVKPATAGGGSKSFSPGGPHAVPLKGQW